MRSFIIILVPLFVAQSLFGQQFVIQGQVLSATSREPLSFATLSVAGGTQGTISNSDGRFRLVLNFNHRSDSLKVSYVGYQTQVIQLSQLHATNLVIEMVEKEEQLDEVVVTSLTANQILENAMALIPKNYFGKAHSSTGFYRLSSKKNGKYVHLSEVAFDLYRSKQPEKVDQFRLDTWRGITDEREANGIELGMRPSGIFDLDRINSKEFPKTFSKKKFLNEHHLVLEGEYYYENKEVFLISFDQRDGIKTVGLQGQIYINKEDFAFVELDYGISPKSVQYFKFGVAYRALMELFGIDIKVLGDRSTIRYGKIGDKYYLKNASLNTDLQFKSDRSHYNFVLNTRVDYLVSQVDTARPVKFPDSETLAHGKLIEFQDVAYDSLFWRNHTIVLPTTDFKEISNEILANNRANDTKKEVEKRLRRFPKAAGGRIDSILTFYHQKGLFYGNALVEDEGEIILNKSYPWPRQSLTTDSRFRIGSVSKTFTAMLILQLEHEGKLQLSDKVRKYLPDYIHGKVTIAQLLSHQSGIPDYLSKSEYLADIFETKYSLEDLIRKFCSDSLDFAPGDSFSYSNSGYVVLAKVAEKAGGMDFSQLLSEKILIPTGMHHTGLGTESGKESSIPGFYYGEPEVSYPIENVIGAGGIISTTEDLLRWSRALEKDAVFDRSVVDKARTPRAEYKDWEAYYGYGWMIDRYLFAASKKNTVVYHPGTDIAFYSMFLKQPEDDITVLMLSHCGDFPRFELSELILEVLN